MPVLELLRTAVVPLLVAVGIALLSSRLRERWQPLGAAIGVAVAFVVAHLWIAGWTPFPPNDATDSAFWLAPLGLLPALLPAEEFRRTALALWALMAAAVVWFVMRPLAGYYGWTALTGTMWCGGAALALVLLARPLRGDVDSAAPAALGIAATGAGVCAMLVHSAKLSQLSFALAVALAGISALLLWRPTWHPFARGASAVGAVALGCLLLSIRLYAELAWLPFLFLALSWASLELVPFLGHRLRPRTSLVVHTLLAMVPAAAAVVLALVERMAQQEDPYY